jgi:hypothetical protein
VPRTSGTTRAASVGGPRQGPGNRRASAREPIGDRPEAWPLGSGCTAGSCRVVSPAAAYATPCTEDGTAGSVRQGSASGSVCQPQPPCETSGANHHDPPQQGIHHGHQRVAALFGPLLLRKIVGIRGNGRSAGVPPEEDDAGDDKCRPQQNRDYLLLIPVFWGLPISLREVGRHIRAPWWRVSWRRRRRRRSSKACAGALTDAPGCPSECRGFRSDAFRSSQHGCPVPTHPSRTCRRHPLWFHSPCDH